MKKKATLILNGVLIIIGLFILWQLSLYRYLSKKPLSYGGDWSYRVKCPTGTFCEREDKQPLAGGPCKPFLTPLFDIF